MAVNANNLKERFGSRRHQWALVSYGPNEQINQGNLLMWGLECLLTWPGDTVNLHDGCLYDATNGSKSEGDIIPVGP